jgi:hypothetical protein
VDEIQKALGESFGGTLWFAVLLTLLALFGGGYVYLIYNYADFTDIPILNGPQRGLWSDGLGLGLVIFFGGVACAV